MNTLLKKTNIISRILTTRQLIKAGSLVPLRKQQQPRYTSSLVSMTSRFAFSDKPPKGFESFDRKRRRSSSPDKPDKEKTEKPEKTEEDKVENKNEEKEKDDDKSNKEKGKKSDSEGEDKDNNNDGNKKGDPKGGDNKEFMINSLLAGLIFAFGFSYMKGSGHKEITMIVN